MILKRKLRILHDINTGKRYIVVWIGKSSVGKVLNQKSSKD